MSDDLIFYTNPMSRGRIVRWMLEEVGAPYQTEIVDYAAIGGDAYRAVNPMAKVPAIVHNGQVVTECAAICAYLAAVYPAAGLGPEPQERADYYRWMFFAAGPVEQAVVDKAMGFTPSEQQGRMCGYGSFDRVVAMLETLLGGRDYVTGARFTAADVYLGSQIGWGLRFGTLPASPIFSAYWARLAARSAQVRAVEIDDALSPQPMGA